MTLETFFFLHPLFTLFFFAISTVLFYLKAFYSVYTPNTGPFAYISKYERSKDLESIQSSTTPDLGHHV